MGDVLPLSTPTFDILASYIDAGMPVLPVWGLHDDGRCRCPAGDACPPKQRGKHPHSTLALNGYKSATLDKAILAEWLRRAPNCNWAIRSGMPLTDGGFLVVVDVDPRNDGDQSIAQIQGQHGELPETWRQDSGGNGHHYLLRSKEPCASRAPAPGIDILAEGKYFLVYPSKHHSGNEYTWGLGTAPGDVPIADAPEWVLEASSGLSRPARDGQNTARDTVLGEAFALADMLGVPLMDGSIAVRCPWADEHSDNRGRGEDSSTVVLPPAGGSRFGGFKCMHSHCSQRTWTDVMQILPPHATTAARQKFPLRAVADDDEPTPTVATSQLSDFDYQINECRKKLAYKTVKGGFKLQCDLVNAVTILTYDPRWAGILKYDEFGVTIRFTREPLWHPDDKPRAPLATVNDDAVNCLDNWFRRYWGLELAIEKIMQAVSIVAQRDAYNPLQNYLDSLTWDGTSRLDMWLSNYLGAENTRYTRTVGRKWLISAVARAYKPGCKADHVLILEGDQGRGKSTALSTLMPDASWFADTPIDIGNKDAYVSLRGKWIMELAELSSLRKADLDRAKAFFSSPKDTYRPPYGRVPQDFPRQCVFAGTVNLEQYLSDETGNRRFWPVKVGAIQLEELAMDRDQIWAEAVSIYKDWVSRGAPLADCLWWPAYDEKKLFSEAQDSRVVVDAWADTVGPWLESPTARNFVMKHGYVTQQILLEECLKIPMRDVDRAMLIRLGLTMSQLEPKWGRRRVRHGNARVYVYAPNMPITDQEEP